MNTTAPTPDLTIHLFCMTCGHRLRAAAGMAGRQTACPVCDATLRVPTTRLACDPHGDAPTKLDMPALTSTR